jgi:CubicO group peptidase (beta-lactamase class C family)
VSVPPSMTHVDRLMQTAVAEAIFPGAVLKVIKDGETAFEKAYGAANRFSRKAMTKDTVFDLASLTKPLATVLAVMALVKRGWLNLEQPCGELCPHLAGTDKARITLRQLLNHSAGLPPWRPYFMTLRRIDAGLKRTVLHQLLANEPLLWSPGRRSEYSDLGYMVLQQVVEAVIGSGLDAFVEAEIYRPLHIGGLFFCPLSQRRGRVEDYAATQLCPWRAKLLVGRVDDDNAYAMGGVGGHAGLFGTADGVAALLQALLAADQDGDGGECFEPALVRAFFKSGDSRRWALGFDTPSATGSSAGRYFPGESVGHLGFTGTSFWMHRQQRVIVVLLTNRVHPWRYTAGIRQFRPQLHDAVMEALGVV